MFTAKVLRLRFAYAFCKLGGYGELLSSAILEVHGVYFVVHLKGG